MRADDMGRQPDPDDYLFLATKLLPRKASEPLIAKRVRQMATKAGLRDKRTKNGTRFPTQLVHGFRKFFNKTCKEKLSGDSLASLIRIEYMMGHQGLVSLDQNYFKTSMLELAAEYVKIVPDLTIDDAERLRHTTKRMSASIQEMEAEKDVRIAQLEEKVRQLEEMRLGAINVKKRLEESLEEAIAARDEEMRALRKIVDALAERENLRQAS